MLFKDIPGLEEIKTQLIQAVKNNQIAHAQLFLSKNGGANLPLALAYASYINCEQPLENDSCGSCASCSKNDKIIHPDVHFVYPVSSTKNITGKDVISTNFLKEWRDFLLNNPYGNVNQWTMAFGGENKQVNISKEESRQIIKRLSLKAFEGKYKVMIIWLPEYMNGASANAILKILEEPPERTIFLLVCNDDEQLLTTILSRTQIVKIRQFDDNEMMQLLIEQLEVDATKAERLAHLADGDLDEAMILIEGSEEDNHDLFRSWMRLCFTHDFTNMVEMAETFHKSGKVVQRSLLQYGLSMMRESLLATAGATEMHRIQGEEEKFIENFSKVMTFEKVENFNNLINDALYHLERNANAKITFMNLSLQIARFIK
ncbi:MAG: DNA polymerase III subunit delta [Cyclobacteriaceae bacterium]|nr:DNA polymerase III subunit delta [Cyclobacteriaceae bacterium]